MGTEEINKSEISTALYDIGMDSKNISAFMNSFNNGEKEKSLQILFKYRSNLLSDLHCSQDKIYRVDYLIRILR